MGRTGLRCGPCVLVGVRGFEPPASTSRTWRSTKLSHTPRDLHRSSGKSPTSNPQCSWGFHSRAEEYIGFSWTGQRRLLRRAVVGIVVSLIETRDEERLRWRLTIPEEVHQDVDRIADVDHAVVVGIGSIDAVWRRPVEE